MSNDNGTSWSAPQQVSTSAEGYAFHRGLDVPPNGRVDLAYQALTAKNPAIFGAGNAAIHAYYVNNVNGSWSAPTRVSTAPSDPAATSQNNLGRQFFGDYNTLVSTNDKAFFAYTDSRCGAACPASDGYQVAVFGTGVTSVRKQRHLRERDHPLTAALGANALARHAAKMRTDGKNTRRRSRSATSLV